MQSVKKNVVIALVVVGLFLGVCIVVDLYFKDRAMVAELNALKIEKEYLMRMKERAEARGQIVATISSQKPK